MTYLVNTSWRQAELRPRGTYGDNPAWLISAGALWVVALFMPVYDYGGSPTPLTGVSSGIQVAVLALGIAAVGIGVYRRNQRNRIVDLITLAVALMLSLGIGVAPFVVTQLPYTDDPGYWFSTVFATLSLSCALLYLIDAAQRAIRRRSQASTNTAPGAVEPAAKTKREDAESATDDI